MNPVLMKVGLVPTLAVRGRRSGEWRTVPVNMLELDGQRYLVAPRGDTHWARNLRASGRGELRTRRGAEEFDAVEVPRRREGGDHRRLRRTLGKPGQVPVQAAA